MSDFWNLITTEADIELTDNKNLVLDGLLSNKYDIGKYQLEFKPTHNNYYDGLLKITYLENVCELVFSVYIFEGEIYTSISTCDLVKLIDIRSDIFIEKFSNILLKDALV